MAIGTIEEFANYLQGRGLSPHTIKAFTFDVGQWLKSGLSPSDWFTQLKSQGLTNKTIARKRTSLASYAKWAGLALDLPPIKSEKRLPNTLTEAEAKALIHEAGRTSSPERDSLIVNILLRTGIRESDLLSLTAGDIVEDKGLTILTIRQGKGAKDRQIPVVDRQLQKQLKTYTKRMLPSDRLFSMSDRNLRKIISNLGNKAGITRVNVHPHLLRHTSATLYLRKGANLETIRRILGHESLATTQIYLQLTTEDIARDLSGANF